MKTVLPRVGGVLGLIGVLVLGQQAAYGHKRPLPPPVIVVKPVPKVEIYRLTPYWMAVPSYEFRYKLRYPPGPRAYRGVYVGWPWPVYVPYESPPPIGSAIGPYVGGSGSGLLSPQVAPPEPFWEEQPGWPTVPSPPGSPIAPPKGPPEPPPEEPLPELIPPPMPQPALPGPEPKG